MLKVINRLYKRHNLLLAIVCAISIAVLSLMKIEKPPISFSFSYMDKVQHTIAYFVLTFLWLTALAKNKWQAILTGFFCFLFGIIIEILQGTTTTYRTAEVADGLANTMGVIMALLIFNVFIKKKQSI